MSVRIAVDTATDVGSIAVARGGRVLCEVALGLRGKLAESLVPALDHVLRLTGVEPTAIEGVVVGAGPGSFTGVRIAAATAKGMRHALDAELLAYPSLMAIAAAVPTSPGRRVCALIDARRDRVYAAWYAGREPEGLETLRPPAVLPVQDVLEAGEPVDTTFVGSGASAHAERLRAGGGTVAGPHLAAPRASALLYLARTMPDAGRVADPAAWEPLYLKDPGVGRPP